MNTTISVKSISMQPQAGKQLPALLDPEETQQSWGMDISYTGTCPQFDPFEDISPELLGFDPKAIFQSVTF